MASLGALSAIASIASAGAGIASGFSARSAANQEAGFQQEQADLQMEDAVSLTKQRERDVRKFVGMQAMQYAGSGVTLEGSPLLLLNETRQMGQEEIDSIWKRGKAVQLLGYQNAQQTRNQGRSALIGSIGQAGTGLLNNYVNQKQASVKSSYAGPWAADSSPRSTANLYKRIYGKKP